MVSHDGREIARRCGPLTAAGRDNDEAELQAPDLEPEPERWSRRRLRPRIRSAA